MDDDLNKRGEAVIVTFLLCGHLGFISQTLPVPNVIPKDTEHSPNFYLTLIPEMIQQANVSFWEASKDPNYFE